MTDTRKERTNMSTKRPESERPEEEEWSVEITAGTLRETALLAAAQRRAGLSEVYREDVARNVIADAEVFLAWLEDDVTDAEGAATSTTVEREKCPAERNRLVGHLMSNFDYAIDVGVMEAMEAPDSFATYPGRNFHCDKVWLDDGRWCAQVWRYGRHVDTASSDSPEGLMKVISDKYGWD